jgi:hypothetical protein
VHTAAGVEGRLGLAEQGERVSRFGLAAPTTSAAGDGDGEDSAGE